MMSGGFSSLDARCFEDGFQDIAEGYLGSHPCSVAGNRIAAKP